MTDHFKGNNAFRSCHAKNSKACTDLFTIQVLSLLQDKEILENMKRSPAGPHRTADFSLLSVSYTSTVAEAPFV